MQKNIHHNIDVLHNYYQSKLPLYEQTRAHKSNTKHVHVVINYNNDNKFLFFFLFTLLASIGTDLIFGILTIKIGFHTKIKHFSSRHYLMWSEMWSTIVDFTCACLSVLPFCSFSAASIKVDFLSYPHPQCSPPPLHQSASHLNCARIYKFTKKISFISILYIRMYDEVHNIVGNIQNIESILTS